MYKILFLYYTIFAGYFDARTIPPLTRMIRENSTYEKVQEGNDQEMVQSEREPHSKNRGGEN